jgi:aryl-alcohol dehydrogenase-like predicted oxidoreductase
VFALALRAPANTALQIVSSILCRQIYALIESRSQQLAIAWVNKNPRVSTVILGASKLSQLQDNLGALALTPKLTPEVLARIDTISKPLAV